MLGVFEEEVKGCWRSLLAVRGEFNSILSDKCLATSKHLSIQSSTPVVIVGLSFRAEASKLQLEGQTAGGAMGTRPRPLLYRLSSAAFAWHWRPCDLHILRYFPLGPSQKNVCWPLIYGIPKSTNKKAAFNKPSPQLRISFGSKYLNLVGMVFLIL